jgi:hypothetical protein
MASEATRNPEIEEQLTDVHCLARQPPEVQIRGITAEVEPRFEAKAERESHADAAARLDADRGIGG